MHEDEMSGMLWTARYSVHSTVWDRHGAGGAHV
jgi:hypothetical protein